MTALLPKTRHGWLALGHMTLSLAFVAALAAVVPRPF